MKRKAKFKVGQVVFWKTGGEENYPFKITKRYWSAGESEWSYFSFDDEFMESQLRHLTKRERGQ